MGFSRLELETHDGCAPRSKSRRSWTHGRHRVQGPRLDSVPDIAWDVSCVHEKPKMQVLRAPFKELPRQHPCKLLIRNVVRGIQRQLGHVGTALLLYCATGCSRMPAAGSRTEMADISSKSETMCMIQGNVVSDANEVSPRTTVWITSAAGTAVSSHLTGADGSFVAQVDCPSVYILMIEVPLGWARAPLFVATSTTAEIKVWGTRSNLLVSPRDDVNASLAEIWALSQLDLLVDNAQCTARARHIRELAASSHAGIVNGAAQAALLSLPCVDCAELRATAAYDSTPLLDQAWPRAKRRWVECSKAEESGTDATHH